MHSNLETEVSRSLHHGVEVGDARVVHEGRHRVQGAGVFPRDADAVGLQNAERFEDVGVGDAGHAEIVPDEGRETRDTGFNAGVS